ncbi:MAG: DUF1330 domain-containing protein [bacterium]|nr:DUF1330 domain-containing protein [bacterium]
MAVRNRPTLWPDAETTRAVWHSPEYWRVRELRANAGEVNVVVAEAV